MPRTFTRTDLAIITLHDYRYMSVADQVAYDCALWDAMMNVDEAHYLGGDYRKVDSRQSYELGE